MYQHYASIGLEFFPSCSNHKKLNNNCGEKDERENYIILLYLGTLWNVSFFKCFKGFSFSVLKNHTLIKKIQNVKRISLKKKGWINFLKSICTKSMFIYSWLLSQRSLSFPNNLVFISNVTMVTKLVQLALFGAWQHSQMDV